MMKKKNTLWYLRDKGLVSGPFPNSIIINHLVLGRLCMQDEVSSDKHNWHRIIDFEELHPQLDNNKNKEKLKRRLDERTGFDRREIQAASAENGQVRKQERRLAEPDNLIQSRQSRSLLMKKFRAKKPTFTGPLTLIFSILVVITILAVLFPTLLPVPLPNCSEPAAKGVNWSNCLKPNLDASHQDLSTSQMRNSQLTNSNFMNATLENVDFAYSDLSLSNFSYANLRSTVLIGTNFKGSDLSNSDLTDADLSYADLNNANLGGSILDNARFDHAIWVNGQKCAEGSIGQCIFAPK